MESKVKTDEKSVKPIKPVLKYIWFAVSVVVAFAGGLCRTGGVKLPFWGSVVYTAALLFAAIVAAQKTSVERFSFAEDMSNRKKYILLSILYYVFILTAVFYVFLSLWISRVISV